MWDRSKQNYWISRRGNPWTVRRSSDNSYVCDFPQHCYDSVKEVCFADSDEVVKAITEKLLIEFENAIDYTKVRIVKDD